MASILNLPFRYTLSPLSPKIPLPQPSMRLRFSHPFPLRHNFPGKLRILSAAGHSWSRKGSKKVLSICCSSKTGSQVERVYDQEDDERPPFDINLAVILAGFAFEAYATPPESIGRREIDAAGCKTVYLSEQFFREIYDGQLFIKLKKGFNFPAMDPWGTSDPYVIMQMDSQTAKSNIKWGTKEPTWNEEFTFNIKQPPGKPLQVAAWDANLVTPHKRMGNAGVDLELLCDGVVHEIEVELEGMGGGGKVQLEWIAYCVRRLGQELGPVAMPLGPEDVLLQDAETRHKLWRVYQRSPKPTSVWLRWHSLLSEEMIVKGVWSL